MLAGVTGVASGKNANTKSGHKKTKLAMLIAAPKRPNDQRRSGSGCLLKRLYSTHDIVRMYEDINAEIVTELIAFNATADPRFISETSMTIPRETMMALRGMFALRLI